jgi:hypothetical protein
MEAVGGCLFPLVVVKLDSGTGGGMGAVHEVVLTAVIEGGGNIEDEATRGHGTSGFMYYCLRNCNPLSEMDITMSRWVSIVCLRFQVRDITGESYHGYLSARVIRRQGCL